jgi:hypothetical protein
LCAWGRALQCTTLNHNPKPNPKPLTTQDSATLQPDAGAIVKEMAGVAGVYIITHVLDEVGEATVRGALEAGDLIGNGPHQVKPHRSGRQASPAFATPASAWASLACTVNHGLL